MFRRKRSRARSSADDLFSRNRQFVEPQLQARLADVPLLIAGTGVGSVIALLAARTGFQHFVVADGDTVQLSNLNRQVFSRTEIGQNKAKVTARLIRHIVPTASIQVVPRFLTAADLGPVVNRAGLIINTIDLDHPAFLELNRVAALGGKPVLFPLNIGWAGCLVVFGPGSATLEEFIGAGADPAVTMTPSDSPLAQLETRLIEQIVSHIPGGIPPYLQALLPRFQLRDSQSWPYDPQLGVAAQVTAALAVRAAVALVAGEPVRVAPEVIWCDTWSAVTSSVVAPGPYAVPDRSGPETWPNPSSVAQTNERPWRRWRTPVASERSDQNRSPRASATVGTVDFARRQAEACYPLLLDVPSALPGGSRRLLRPGSGLVIVTAEHGALTPAALQAIGEFRLHQYVLAGLYDRGIVEQAHVTIDPALEALHPQDHHIVIGDSCGRLLCYVCLQSPLPWPGPLADAAAVPVPPSVATDPAPVLAGAMVNRAVADTNRPLFAVETEYGDIYRQHPGLAPVPLSRVRELTHLVRNQVIRTPRDRAIIIEAMVAIARVICDPADGLEAIIGCASPEVRRLLDKLVIPVAYAPDAPIRGNNLGGGGPTGPLLWADAAHAPERFWPFAISGSDARALEPFFNQLDVALALPPEQVEAGVQTSIQRQRSSTPSTPSTLLVRAPEEGGIRWTSE